MARWINKQTKRPLKTNSGFKDTYIDSKCRDGERYSMQKETKDLRPKAVTRDKEGNYIMTKRSINQENINHKYTYTHPTVEHLNILNKC